MKRSTLVIRVGAMVGALVLLTSACELAPPPDAATVPTTVTVTGTVTNGAGLTVLSLGLNGLGLAKRVDSLGRFTLRLPIATAKDTTLHLVNPNGSYFGPVVLYTHTSRAYMYLGGVAVNLGAITKHAGYARIHHALPLGSVDVTRYALSNVGGKPNGAGKLGMTSSHVAQTAVAAQAVDTNVVAQTVANAQPGADPDHDGIPNAVDVDDNGNGNIDATDPTTPTASSGAGLFSTLFLGYTQALNADAGSVTRSDIDAVFPTNFNMVFFYSLAPGGPSYTSADVNCSALVYCRAGDGTAIYSGLSESPPPSMGLAWNDFNGNGHPNNLVHIGGAWAAGILPQATTESISPGDTFGLNFRNGSTTTTAMTSLSPYFVTTPAISSWHTSLDSETVSYPITDQRGTDGTPAAIGADGLLDLSLWRPQRMAIAGAEPGTFVDMGHLHYGITVSTDGMTPGEWGCASNLTSLSPSLDNQGVDPPSDPRNLFPLLDNTADAAPSTASQLSFTVDLAGCLANAGVSNPAGHIVRLTVTAATDGRSGGMDRAAQNFTVQFPG